MFRPERQRRAARGVWWIGAGRAVWGEGARPACGLLYGFLSGNVGPAVAGGQFGGGLRQVLRSG